MMVCKRGNPDPTALEGSTPTWTRRAHLLVGGVEDDVELLEDGLLHAAADRADTQAPCPRECHRLRKDPTFALQLEGRPRAEHLVEVKDLRLELEHGEGDVREEDIVVELLALGMRHKKVLVQGQAQGEQVASGADDLHRDDGHVGPHELAWLLWLLGDADVRERDADLVEELHDLREGVVVRPSVDVELRLVVVLEAVRLGVVDHGVVRDNHLQQRIQGALFDDRNIDDCQGDDGLQNVVVADLGEVLDVLLVHSGGDVGAEASEAFAQSVDQRRCTSHTIA